MHGPRNRLHPTICGTLAVVASCSPAPVEVVHMDGLTGFEAQLDSLRVELQIPALSAAIVAEGNVVWARGFGYADVRAGRIAADTTAYHLASLTKTFATIILMQFVESGDVDLDDYISEYGIDLPNAENIRIRHLMTHTSEGTPGTTFRYNGNRFGEITQVIERVSGRRLADLIVERILHPLNLRHTAPNVRDDRSFEAAGLERAAFEANMARAYELREGQVVESEYPSIFNAAGGLIGSVVDVARYSIAIDQGQFLEPETWDTVFTPARSADRDLPAALGWLVYEHAGVTVHWMYGWWTANSSLIVRVPERGLTFVAAANTDAMSSRYGLGADGNALRSDVARLFIEAFVTGDEPLPVAGLDR